jgi:ATP synthase protein I
MSLTPEELEQKIRDARARQERDAPKPPSSNRAASVALKAATDLVAALVVGALLGYWIDRWIGTKPWGMIIFLFLGFGAGFLNIYRAQMEQMKKDKEGKK